MFLRLAAFLREQLDPLVVQYDERLRTVPGYANLPRPRATTWNDVLQAHGRLPGSE
jgi:hypothetical protein